MRSARFRPIERHGIEQAGRPAVGDVQAEVAQILAQTLDQGGEIDRAGILAARLLAGKGERRLGHALHLVQRLQDLGARLVVVDELGAQAQRGHRRAQIVRDRREHAGAVLDEALQARRASD